MALGKEFQAKVKNSSNVLVGVAQVRVGRPSVRAAGIGVAEAASGQDEIRMQFVKTVHDAIREDGAQAILLASGGLTGQAPAISKASGIPVVDGVEEAIRRSLALIEKANYLKA
jgi:Asp/Glu/hydantoin racemase